MAKRFTAAQLVGAELIWLLAIEWAGRTYRWSSRPCDPLDEDEEAVPHDGGLPDLEFEEGFSLLSLTPDTRAVSLELDFPVDVAALIQDGHDLAAATGELALWREGDAYEDRIKVLLGNVSEPEYGAEGEPVALTIEAAPWDDRGLVPEAAARVTTQTWPTANNSAAGLYYPLPFGTPGVFRDVDGEERTTSGSPGLVVEVNAIDELADTLLIAGDEVEADTVSVFSSEGVLLGTGAVTRTTDGLGRTVSVVDISGESASFRGYTEYWIAWSSGGGILLSDRSAAITGAGDMILWLMRWSSVAHDYGRCFALRGALNAYKVSGYIDEAVSPVAWLVDNLLPLLPVSLVFGPDGVYPVLWRLNAGTEDALETITAGPGIERTGPVRYVRPPRDVINEYRLSFAPRARTGEFRRTLTCTPDPDLTGADEFTTHYSRLSGSRYGRRGEAVETDIVYDAPTAGAIIEWWIRARALPIRSVVYETGIQFGWLEPGDVVVLNDDEIAFSDQVVLVEAVKWLSEVSLELTLLVTEDPARDR